MKASQIDTTQRLLTFDPLLAVEPAAHALAKCFEELSDMVSQPIWVVHHDDGKVLYANRSWRSLTEIDAGDKFPGGFLAMIHPDDRSRWSSAWQQALRTGTAYEIGSRIRFTTDQEHITLLERARPIRSADGDVECWVLTACRQEQTHLIDTLRHKDEALLAIVHEMRGPLGPICGAVELLDRASDPASVSQVRAMIARQAGQLTRLIEDLVEVGRLEHKQISVRNVRIDLRQVLATAVETAQPFVSERGHRLSTATMTEDATTYGDEGRLTQLLVNLLINAAKFTDPGGQIWLSLQKNERSFVVKVRDTGVGIAREMLPHIFDAYVSGASSGRSSLGLGLALARQFAALHGGLLTAHSDGAGKGSEFVLMLPVPDTR